MGWSGQQDGWLVFRLASGSNFSLGMLYITADGGQTWQKRTAPLGEPAYFHHVRSSVSALLAETGASPGDFRHAVFHQPNAQFPLKVADELGFSRAQVEPFVLTSEIGNTYSGAVLIAFAKALETQAQGASSCSGGTSCSGCPKRGSCGGKR